MRTSVRLGRLAGIPVGLNWTLVVIAGLLTVTLANGVLPFLATGQPAAAYWLAGAAGAALFLGSIVAHELGHAVVAQRHGVPVHEITLWLLGGVAKLGREPATPRAELRIALAGPAVSVAIGAAGLATAAAFAAAGAPALLVGLLGWLGLVNLVLAAFNLLPASPLDGGRVLRGLLWRRHGDRVRATLTASRAGRFLGTAMIVSGLANTFLGVGYGTLWTVLLGWFLVSAAAAEERMARFEQARRQAPAWWFGDPLARLVDPHEGRRVMIVVDRDGRTHTVTG